jgi:hypothetical protein
MGPRVKREDVNCGVQSLVLRSEQSQRLEASS